MKRCRRDTTAGRIWLGSVVQKMKSDALGRLLEGLEQDVPALLDALDLVDDEDLATQVGGGRVDARHELAHVVDLVVRGGVELDDVERTAVADGDAAGAGVTGLAIAQVGAVDGLGQDAGHRGLAGAARPDEQEGMADAPEADGVAQRLDDRLLADHLGEGLGAEAPIDGLWGAPAAAGSSSSGCPSCLSVAPRRLAVRGGAAEALGAGS